MAFTSSLTNPASCWLPRSRSKSVAWRGRLNKTVPYKFILKLRRYISKKKTTSPAPEVVFFLFGAKLWAKLVHTRWTLQKHCPRKARKMGTFRNVCRYNYGFEPRMLHHKKPRNRKGYEAFLFGRGQIMGKILKSEVDNLGGLFVLTVDLVGICFVSLHAF